MNYYELYCGDYQRDAAHLSLAEHGAYTMPLDTYFSDSAPVESPDYSACLIGLATAHNNKHGYESTLPILIGNEQKARQVRLGGSDRPILELKRLSVDLAAIRRMSADERIALAANAG